MLAPWMIDKLKEDQAREDEASWSRQPRVEVDDAFLRPPPPMPEPRSPLNEGGVVIVDFTI